MTQNNQNLIDKIATPIRIECKVSWECACRVASQILGAIELDEGEMARIIKDKELEGYEAGSLEYTSRELAQALASAKGKVIKIK